ncbi:hypothetical protein B0H19DRAFT_1260664 [Mycena capillaripes]|nr:hypothetical protein B0H19DRAFT_1260664 [Mycena capillaripes]
MAVYFVYNSNSVTLVLLALAFSAFPTTLGESRPFVNTTSRFYVGIPDAQNEVDVFKGIRFASAAKRIDPSTPISNASPGLQSAIAFGADCPQLTFLL